MSGTVSSVMAISVLAALTFPHVLSMYGIDEYVSYVREQPGDLMMRYSEAGEALNSSELAADASVFVVWGITGLIGYALIASIIRAIRNIAAFERDIKYFQAYRAGIIREALVHVFVRLLAASLILGVYFIATTIIIPAITAAVQTALVGGVAVGIGLYLASLLAVMASLHVVVILTRLIVLRTRVFYDKYYVAE